MLRAWGQRDNQVAENACQAIYNLVYENDADKTRLNGSNLGVNIWKNSALEKLDAAQ
jgi:hypothetical protein